MALYLKTPLGLVKANTPRLQPSEHHVWEGLIGSQGAERMSAWELATRILGEPFQRKEKPVFGHSLGTWSCCFITTPHHHHHVLRATNILQRQGAVVSYKPGARSQLRAEKAVFALIKGWELVPMAVFGARCLTPLSCVCPKHALKYLPAGSCRAAAKIGYFPLHSSTSYRSLSTPSCAPKDIVLTRVCSIIGSCRRPLAPSGVNKVAQAGPGGSASSSLADRCWATAQRCVILNMSDAAS
eukprot:1150620-Pelagomonas_calceolata.AAC.6